MKIRLRSHYAGNIPQFGVDHECLVSESLFQLLKRPFITPLELHLLHKIGLKVEINGELRKTIALLNREGVSHSVDENATIHPFDLD